MIVLQVTFLYNFWKRLIMKFDFNLKLLLCCSDAKNMASDVRNIIIKILIEKGEMTEQNAQAYLKKMEIQKRLSSDVWS